MPRKKVKLAFIVNDTGRKASYIKRKNGLLKKMDELTTLCDVKACAILETPYEPHPVVWPTHAVAREMIECFEQLPEIEKVEKMVSHQDFLQQRLTKAEQHLEKQQRDNRVEEVTQIMHQCLVGKSIEDLSLLELSDLNWVVNDSLTKIYERIDILKHEKSNEDHSLEGEKSVFNDLMDMQMMDEDWLSFMDGYVGPTIYPQSSSSKSDPHEKAEN
ncbi:agamous-like MADS-box protein AGL80 [Amaranthus tricolor]|uniref:agamous-like MADS-box protein AGL80 n=1 Tax=Amaranthus tricolor TaxID=29722 RepID=UPI0025891493|nr:agamous-like MADS-box protein AGL80 [Amaranthus tricolor]